MRRRGTATRWLSLTCAASPFEDTCDIFDVGLGHRIPSDVFE